MIFILLAIFQIKHFLADYLLQNKYMLNKFNLTGWILPLSAHAGVHALFTFGIVTAILSLQLGIILALFDFIAHFTIDRIKASPNLLGRFKPDQDAFWITIGLDQMAHHFVHYIIIYFMIINIPQ